MSALIVPNPSDVLLSESARRALCFRRPGGSAGMRRDPDAPREIDWPWWLYFPVDGRYFTKNSVIGTPALGSSLTPIVSFNVPAGWDGVIRKMSWNYTGGGFVQGSGDLSWFVRIAGAMAPDYFNVLSEFGSPQQPRDTTIIVREGQLVELLVSVAVVAAIPIAGTFIIGFMDGWFVPRQTT
jgi:hypothetical protein